MFGSIATGIGAVWVLQTDGTLLRIDPSTNRIAARYKTGAIETNTLEVVGGYVWICECQFNQVRRFDARHGNGPHVQDRRERVHRSGRRSEGDAVRSKERDGDGRWIPQTGDEESPVGLAGQPQDAAVLDGIAWIAAGPVVDRVNITSGKKSEIDMPKGV